MLGFGHHVDLLLPQMESGRSHYRLAKQGGIRFPQGLPRCVCVR